MSRLRTLARTVLGRLRTRIALASALASALALLGAGAFVLDSATRADRSDLDRALQVRAGQAVVIARRSLRLPVAQGRPARRAARRVGRLLGRVPASGDVAIIRLVRGGAVLERLGVPDDPGLPTAIAGDGAPVTVPTQGGRWRMVQRPIGRGIAVQVAAPLRPLDDRRETLRDRLLVAGAGGVAVTGLLALLLAGPALGALTRLRSDAGRIASTDDLAVRTTGGGGPAEVRDLARSIDAMLARLESSDAERRAAHEASRRFAADAGHELRTPLTALSTTVQALRDHPELTGAERTEMLTEVVEEHARLFALLDALQALARGESSAGLTPTPVDVADVAGAAVAAARVGADGAGADRVGGERTTIELRADEGASVDGWEPGVRLLVDNLLTNALRHGREGGLVRVEVVTTTDGVVVTVDDDGTGIAADQRAAVRGRFVRGPAVKAPGSGLGLALVEQQAHLHGGDLELVASSLGGLRARVTLRGLRPNGRARALPPSDAGPG